MQIHVLLERIAALSAATALIAATDGAHAARINVQVLGHATDPKGQPDPPPPCYQGPGVIGAEGDYWNGVYADVFGRPLKIVRPWRMLAADGTTPTGVTLKFSGFHGADHWPQGAGAPVDHPLMNSYLVCRAEALLVIGGLVPGGSYDLYLFGNNSHAGAGGRFSVNGGQTQGTQGKEGAVFTRSVDYVEFKAVQADQAGRLRVAISPGGAEIAVFNGFQLRGEFPPPPPPTAGADKRGWPVKLWLTAEDLARAGLKPGDPVTEWKDAIRGIRLRPNPKPPYNDKPPRYTELRVPAGARAAPAVQFDGEASLRQHDVVDVLDTELTGFVVYRPDETSMPAWQEMFAKRADSLCLYEGDIATPRHPRLYYSVYRENGIRLGATPPLPLVLAGHQDERNPGPRFRGAIAEVVILARQFAPDDEQREIVESYLFEKYLRAPSKPRALPEAPWRKAAPAGVAFLPTSPAEAAGRAAAPHTPDKGSSLGGVNIFSLGSRRGDGRVEYAAGEATLPFTYAASVSKAPRPPCFEFSPTGLPDCCHALVVMDGELWMFRADWAQELGSPSRYRGPDIDHLTRVEDGKYPAEAGLCWFLGGMWYDEADRKLYAPLHIEQEGNHRFHPAGGWFSRKIGLATSVDKGKTWKYEGDIITPETYFYTHEVYKFSGSWHGNGVCDFGFYVDARGGYTYIFPNESWYKKGEWGALWGVRAARCAIRDKMAPGKWRYFYNGTWDEPALGGKSCVVAPSHLWGILYSEQLGKYVCVFPSCKDGPGDSIDGVMIGVCSDLARQDWAWGYCPEAMFGFVKVLDADGRGLTDCGRTFRLYSFFNGNVFQRTDIALNTGRMSRFAVMPRYAFQPHPESSDPILSRKTKIVGAVSSQIVYTGSWTARSEPASYEGMVMESAAAGSSLEFSFTGSDVYWRAVRSPAAGTARVYLDGALRKTVDCYSPRSMSCEQFAYAKSGLDPAGPHVMKIVVTGEKNAGSKGSAIGHIAIEHSAESYRASSGFSSIMGKNQWNYRQRVNQSDRDLRFFPSDDVFVRDWSGAGQCRVGADYQIPDCGAEAVREWEAPHGGIVRVEGAASLPSKGSPGVVARILRNGEEIWRANSAAGKQAAPHDLTVKVEQGDAVSFVVGFGASAAVDTPPADAKVIWDPVVTYSHSAPARPRLNAPGPRNLACGKYARSKMLAFAYRPFDAVDGDASTAFAVHADDKISSGDDWLQIDLEKRHTINRYVLVSAPPDPRWRPGTFILQRSDDGFRWFDVDSVADNTRERLQRDVAAFSARFVRLYLPRGKPYWINELELYNAGGR